MIKKLLQLVGLALAVWSCGDTSLVEPPRILEGIATYAAAGFQCVIDSGDVEIPDGDLRGLMLGPLEIPETDGELGEILLALDITHEWSGDLHGELHYDVDDDGYSDASAAVEFFQLRPESHSAARLMACMPKLDGLYFFADEPATLNCERVETEARDRADRVWSWSDRPFEPFRELRRGGSFYLAIADTLAEKRGTVNGWAVCLKASRSAH